jgi:N5-(cytidine 5'-diphosphoramidyl)-L-glutamine hydrolase
LRWKSLFLQADNALVNSYHGYAISKNGLAPELALWAESADGFVEAVLHKQYPWVGIMWHPERSSSTLDSAIIEKLFANAQ